MSEIFVATEYDGSRWVSEEDYNALAERAEARVRELEEGLRPFAAQAREYADVLPEDEEDIDFEGATVGDYRRAASLIKQEGEA